MIFTLKYIIQSKARLYSLEYLDVIGKVHVYACKGFFMCNLAQNTPNAERFPCTCV